DVVEALDVGRVRNDDVPSLGGGSRALAESQLDLEAKPLRVLARERERIGRDIDPHDLRVGPLVLERQRDRARADADVEDARRLHAGRREPLLGLGESLPRGHSPSARRRSSVASASVKASSSPWRMRSSWCTVSLTRWSVSRFSGKLYVRIFSARSPEPIWA